MRNAGDHLLLHGQLELAAIEYNGLVPNHLQVEHLQRMGWNRERAVESVPVSMYSVRTSNGVP